MMKKISVAKKRKLDEILDHAEALNKYCEKLRSRNVLGCLGCVLNSHDGCIPGFPMRWNITEMRKKLEEKYICGHLIN